MFIYKYISNLIPVKSLSFLCLSVIHTDRVCVSYYQIYLDTVATDDISFRLYTRVFPVCIVCCHFHLLYLIFFHKILYFARSAV